MVYRGKKLDIPETINNPDPSARDGKKISKNYTWHCSKCTTRYIYRAEAQACEERHTHERPERLEVMHKAYYDKVKYLDLIKKGNNEQSVFGLSYLSSKYPTAKEFRAHYQYKLTSIQQDQDATWGDEPGVPGFYAGLYWENKARIAYYKNILSVISPFSDDDTDTILAALKEVVNRGYPEWFKYLDEGYKKEKGWTHRKEGE